MVEVYELEDKDLRRIKEITLFKDDGETPYTGSKRYYKEPEVAGGFLNVCTTFTNGSSFFLITPCRFWRWSLSDGKRHSYSYTGNVKMFYCPTAKYIFMTDYNSSKSNINKYTLGEY